MAKPTTKTQFKEFCLRKLGKPVIEINVDEDQIDDRIDEALSFYADYHFDGTEKTYAKHRVVNSYLTLTALVEEDFAVGDVVKQTDAAGTATATASMTIIAIDVTNKRLFYKKPSGTFTAEGYITSTTFQAKNGNNAQSVVQLETTANKGVYQGTFELEYIPLSENIIGAINVFNPESNVSLGSGMFNAKYQFVLHNLHEMNHGSLQHFQMSMQHLQLLEELLVGAVPLRFNRHQNKLMLDMDWGNLTVGNYIVIEAYQVVDPNTFTDVWSDRFLQNYATAKIKYQWGSNLTKFNGMTLPGGVQFNGEQILSDAREEILRLEEEMANGYSLPSVDMIG